MPDPESLMPFPSMNTQAAGQNIARPGAHTTVDIVDKINKHKQS